MSGTTTTVIIDVLPAPSMTATVTPESTPYHAEAALTYEEATGQQEATLEE